MRRGDEEEKEEEEKKKKSQTRRYGFYDFGMETNLEYGF